MSNDDLDKKRCPWATIDKKSLMLKYHDEEWGVPVYHDRELFEFLVLEGAQAGLSWSTILNRRTGYQKAFDNFDIAKVASYEEHDVQRLKQDTRIIRNELKIRSAISNAKVVIQLQKEYGSFNEYLWSFVDYKPIINTFKHQNDIPAWTNLSNIIAKEMKKEGFKFVGKTICYAYMQAIGMVNDHIVDCYRYKEINKNY